MNQSDLLNGMVDGIYLVARTRTASTVVCRVGIFIHEASWIVICRRRTSMKMQTKNEYEDANG